MTASRRQLLTFYSTGRHITHKSQLAMPPSSSITHRQAYNVYLSVLNLSIHFAHHLTSPLRVASILHIGWLRKQQQYTRWTIKNKSPYFANSWNHRKFNTGRISELFRWHTLMCICNTGGLFSDVGRTCDIGRTPFGEWSPWSLNIVFHPSTHAYIHSFIYLLRVATPIITTEAQNVQRQNSRWLKT